VFTAHRYRAATARVREKIKLLIAARDDGAFGGRRALFVSGFLQKNKRVPICVLRR
jgi:hypothetical protein